MNVRIVLGAIACILSSTLYASEVSDLVAISSDENATSYLLSDVKRVEASAKDTSSMRMESKEVSENNEPPKIIYASETICIRYFQIPNVYVYVLSFFSVVSFTSFGLCVYSNVASFVFSS